MGMGMGMGMGDPECADRSSVKARFGKHLSMVCILPGWGLGMPAVLRCVDGR